MPLCIVRRPTPALREGNGRAEPSRASRSSASGVLHVGSPGPIGRDVPAPQLCPRHLAASWPRPALASRTSQFPDERRTCDVFNSRVAQQPQLRGTRVRLCPALGSRRRRTALHTCQGTAHCTTRTTCHAGLDCHGPGRSQACVWCWAGAADFRASKSRVCEHPESRRLARRGREMDRNGTLRTDLSRRGDCEQSRYGGKTSRKHDASSARLGSLTYGHDLCAARIYSSAEGPVPCLLSNSVDSVDRRVDQSRPAFTTPPPDPRRAPAVTGPPVPPREGRHRRPDWIT